MAATRMRLWNTSGRNMAGSVIHTADSDPNLLAWRRRLRDNLPPMTAPTADLLRHRFDEFMAHLGTNFVSKPQRTRFAQYVLGLLLPGDRKSMERLAARVDPAHAMARFKTFQRFIGAARWDDLAVRRAAHEWACSGLIERQDKVRAWVVHDVVFPKRGDHSVFVHRPTPGASSSPGNRQVAAGLTFAASSLSVPFDLQIYMPEEWARREAAGVPKAMRYRSKADIALDMIDRAIQEGKRPAPIVCGREYAEDQAFLSALEGRGLEYVGEVSRASDMIPDSLRGAAGKVRRSGSARHPWRRWSWQEGANHVNIAGFDFAGIRTDLRANFGWWAMAEWGDMAPAPHRFWLVSSACTWIRSKLKFVRLAHIGGQVEQDYDELKNELGLTHYEGRGYVGWNHHVTACFAAFSFLLRERVLGTGLQRESFLGLVPDSGSRGRTRGSTGPG